MVVRLSFEDRVGNLSGSRVPAQGLCEGYSKKIPLLRDTHAQWRDEGINPDRILIDAQESPSTMMLWLIFWSYDLS